MNWFDTYHRPLPRFYDLSIERRAEMIAIERSAIQLKRYQLGDRDFYREVRRVMHFDDSVALLDIVNAKRSGEMYQRILVGV